MKDGADGIAPWLFWDCFLGKVLFYRSDPLRRRENIGCCRLRSDGKRPTYTKVKPRKKAEGGAMPFWRAGALQQNTGRAARGVRWQRRSQCKNVARLRMRHPSRRRPKDGSWVKKLMPVIPSYTLSRKGPLYDEIFGSGRGIRPCVTERNPK